MKQLLIILLAATLASCTEKIDHPPGPGSSMEVAFEWRVVDEHDLRAIYQNSGQQLGAVRVGRGVERKDHLRGFVGLAGGKWVVYTLPPERIDDVVTCTLGHEVMHVALGDYHR